MVAVLAMLVGGNNLWAQRYHWEWSPRSPRVMPRTFVGVEGAIGSALHRTTLPYVEDLITCCTFADGTSYRRLASHSNTGRVLLPSAVLHLLPLLL